jgi:D-serine deaminase-like pyridoxal phosphate-dependent protein
MSIDLPMVRHPEEIVSPCLLFSRARIEHNLQRMVEIAGRPERLRPHAKTHKTREITRLEIQRGITKHKCATIAEAELLAEVGAAEVLIAYPLVGPNLTRLAHLSRKFPATRFGCLVEDRSVLAELDQVLAARGTTAEVWLDLDVGHRRTGLPPGEQAFALVQAMARCAALRFGGLHVYDGHNTHADAAERAEAVRRVHQAVDVFRATLAQHGLAPPRIVFGGTPTFALHAALDWPEAEMSPGTCVLHDSGYSRLYPELGFQPAAWLMTRVISRTAADRLTFDLGTKAIASDPPAGQRCVFPALPEAKAVVHNEEHLVLETAQAAAFRPGDVAFAVPTHICPTVALHRFALVLDEAGAVAECWEIAGRDRRITI